MQRFNTVCGLGGDKLDLYAEILGNTARKVNIIALILAVLINIAERVFVRENADLDAAALLDLIECAVDGIIRIAVISVIRRICDSLCNALVSIGRLAACRHYADNHDDGYNDC